MCVWIMCVVCVCVDYVCGEWVYVCVDYVCGECVYVCVDYMCGECRGWGGGGGAPWLRSQDAAVQDRQFRGLWLALLVHHS